MINNVTLIGRLTREVELKYKGNDEFLATHHLDGIYLDYDDFKALGLMSQKLIDELTGKGEK